MTPAKSAPEVTSEAISDDQAYARLAQVPDGTTVPSRAAIDGLAKDRRVVPIVRRLLADGETPVGLYRKLAADRPGTYLLESAEHGGVWSRYSFVGVRCSAMLTEVDGRPAWIGDVPVAMDDLDGDTTALEVMRDTLAALHSPRLAGLPPLTSGLVGMIGYDAVRHWERLPDSTEDDLGLPEVAMLVASDLAVLDHYDGSVLLIANIVLGEAETSSAEMDGLYADAVARIDAMAGRLQRPTTTPAWTFDGSVEPDFQAMTEPEQYYEKVEAAREHIRAGDAFQVVVSQRFQTPTTADALDIYRILRISNPSPYMYLIRFPAAPVEGEPNNGWTSQGGPDRQRPGLGEMTAFSVVGSSPEALVKLDDGRAMMHPIAGSRPRGATPERDAELAEELLADDKERAEHLMLVDLGRNDVGRVSQPGSVEVVEFMEVERYSHIMHIVSTVVGELSPGRTAYDLLAATFPAGTLSGAPKPRAMEIIEDLESTRRGLYGGVVGYLDFAGDMDTAIAIRTAVLRDGMAYVQAGAGLVADSDPVTEEQECRNKAAAVLRAIAVAQTLREATT
ncbi:MAG: anthranilate synthase component I [Candidatus Nanopelagicales bacterium]